MNYGYVIVGSLIVAAFTLIGILIAQRNENKRALRKLAYEMAMTEWREQNAFIRENKLMNRLAVPELYILAHIAWAERVHAAGLARSISVSDYEEHLREHEERIKEMLMLHKKIGSHRCKMHEIEVFADINASIDDNPTDTKS